MKTTDFSLAPRVGQATAMFVGATRYRNLMSVVKLLPSWFRMVRQMKRMKGYCRHFVYYEWPLTLGTIAFFEDRDSMLTFARSRHHRKLMVWATDGTRNAKGGYIRLYAADLEGYSNGIWRAEANEMRHIERFTATSSESEGPSVSTGPRQD